MALNMQPRADLTPELLDAIRTFPLTRQVEHCGELITAFPLDVYATCPHCDTRVKLRAFSGVTEIEDVFDAVLEWLNHPEVEESARRRQLAPTEDD